MCVCVCVCVCVMVEGSVWEAEQGASLYDYVLEETVVRWTTYCKHMHTIQCGRVCTCINAGDNQLQPSIHT